MSPNGLCFPVPQWPMFSLELKLLARENIWKFHIHESNTVEWPVVRANTAEWPVVRAQTGLVMVGSSLQLFVLCLGRFFFAPRLSQEASSRLRLTNYYRRSQGLPPMATTCLKHAHGKAS